MTKTPRLNDELKNDPRGLLKAFAIRPKKRLGQNFLVSRAGIGKVIHAAGLTGDEDVLEIGAGLGTLSIRLAETAKHVIAIEIDEDLLPALEWVLSDSPNVKLLAGDVLAMDLGELGLQPEYIVVANIPYHITSHLIRKLMESPFPAERVVLTIQREVAQRIVAGPGELNLLALGVQVFGRPDIKATIPPDAFYPEPSIESAVIRIDRFRQPLIPAERLGIFFEIARAGFGQRRKQLQNALASGLGIPKARVQNLLEAEGIPAAKRAQELSIEQWISLANRYLALESSSGGI